MSAAGDEVGELARDFNAMAEHLELYRKSSLGDLLVAQRAAQATIDAVPDPVVILDGDRRAAQREPGAAGALGDPGRTRRRRWPAAPGEIRALLETLRAHVAGGHGAYRPSGFEDAVRVSTPEGPRDFLPQRHARSTARPARSPAWRWC